MNHNLCISISIRKSKNLTIIYDNIYSGNNKFTDYLRG